MTCESKLSTGVKQRHSCFVFLRRACCHACVIMFAYEVTSRYAVRSIVFGLGLASVFMFGGLNFFFFFYDVV